jgi:ribosome maturation protein Sdo1
MVENIRRRSRRMLRLDLENEITPSSSPHDLPSIGQMNKETHSDIDNFPSFESQVKGIIKTLE